MSAFDEKYEYYETKGGKLSRSKFYKLYVQKKMSIGNILERHG